MRYYQVTVTDQRPSAATDQSSADEIVVTAKRPVFRSWSSVNPNGAPNPGALNIEIDAPITSFADPMGDTGASLRIWGVSWQDIAKAADFNGMTIEVSAGMSKGLPLANPRQAGLIFSGIIYQAYGNWIGTSMCLTFVVLPNTGTSAAPANLAFSWKRGVALGTAIKATLKTAFPTATINVDSLNSQLVLPADQVGVYQTLVQFSRWLRPFSLGLVSDPDYQGIEITYANNVFRVFDAPTLKNPRAISFLDLVGQPTWLNPFQIQAITTMRADLAIADFVTLPPGLQTIQPQGIGLVKDRTAFSGTFQINGIRHAGNFRQADGSSWITAFDMTQVAPA